VLFGPTWMIALNKMEENNTVVMRVSAEFKDWVVKIQKEFLTKRGYEPTDANISTDIKRQFQGKFIV